MNEIVKVKLSEIDPKSTVNVRRTGIEESVEVVKSSSEKNGYWPEFPVVLRPHPDPQSKFAYENVSGQCRMKASLAVGLEEVPSIIVDLNDDEALQRSLSEGDKRTPLSFSDYTYWVEKKFNEFKQQGCTDGEAYKKTAEFWDIPTTKAKDYYYLGDLPESVKKSVGNKSLSTPIAKAILKSSGGIADEEEKKKAMEAKADWISKIEKKEKTIAKKAMMDLGSNATPEDLDKKMEELGSSGKTLKVELEEGNEPKLKSWGSDRRLPNKTPLSVIASQLINETLGKYRSARDGNKQ